MPDPKKNYRKWNGDDPVESYTLELDCEVMRSLRIQAVNKGVKTPELIRTIINTAVKKFPANR